MLGMSFLTYEMPMHPSYFILSATSSEKLPSISKSKLDLSISVFQCHFAPVSIRDLGQVIVYLWFPVSHT